METRQITRLTEIVLFLFFIIALTALANIVRDNWAAYVRSRGVFWRRVVHMLPR